MILWFLRTSPVKPEIIVITFFKSLQQHKLKQPHFSNVNSAINVCNCVEQSTQQPPPESDCLFWLGGAFVLLFVCLHGTSPFSDVGQLVGNILSFVSGQEGDGGGEGNSGTVSS